MSWMTENLHQKVYLLFSFIGFNQNKCNPEHLAVSRENLVSVEKSVLLKPSGKPQKINKFSFAMLTTFSPVWF